MPSVSQPTLVVGPYLHDTVVSIPASNSCLLDFTQLLSECSTEHIVTPDMIQVQRAFSSSSHIPLPLWVTCRVRATTEQRYANAHSCSVPQFVGMSDAVLDHTYVKLAFSGLTALLLAERFACCGYAV